MWSFVNLDQMRLQQGLEDRVHTAAVWLKAVLVNGDRPTGSVGVRAISAYALKIGHVFITYLGVNINSVKYRGVDVINLSRLDARPTQVDIAPGLFTTYRPFLRGSISAVVAERPPQFQFDSVCLDSKSNGLRLIAKTDTFWCLLPICEFKMNSEV